MNEVFLDSAYAIALSSSTDRHLKKAVKIAKELEKERKKMVTTHAVVLEIGNALSKLRYRHAAIELIDSLERDPTVEFIPITERLFNHAFDLFRSREDKEWGLTDCISFIVMDDRGIREALTTDEHFEQYGFQTLLND